MLDDHRRLPLLHAVRGTPCLAFVRRRVDSAFDDVVVDNVLSRTRATVSTRNASCAATRCTHSGVLEEEESCREVVEALDRVLRLTRGEQQPRDYAPEYEEGPVVEGHGEEWVLAAQHSEQV